MTSNERCRFAVEPFPVDGGIASRLAKIRERASTTSWVISFHSKQQLETAAAMRLGFARDKGGLSVSARPLITADEVDQTIRSRRRDKVLEQMFDGVLGMFDRHVHISSPNKLTVLGGGATGRRHLLGPVLGIVATTSTPVSFLCQFSEELKEHRWRLDGWIWPRKFDNYSSVENYRHLALQDDAVSKSNSYCFDRKVRLRTNYIDYS